MLKEKRTNYLVDDFSCMTPDFFDNLANKMREENISHIEITIDGYDGYATEYSYSEETEKEKEEREKLQKQMTLNKKKLILREQMKVIKNAKNLGLKISIQSPIESTYDHVYWVQKGMDLSNSMDGEFIVPKDGYIWYDESELLGDKKIYTTAKKANEALSKYVKEVLK